jgi:hypothetical protein
MMSEKVRPHHLERKALLYVRQSSAHQVLHNRESSTLQYAMRDRLMALGWSEIEVIDDDLVRGWRRATRVGRPPSPRPALRSHCATQFLIDCAVGSNSCANASGVRPARTNSTIWRRNSSGWATLVLAIVDSSNPNNPVSHFPTIKKSRKSRPNKMPLYFSDERPHDVQKAI